MKRIKFDGDRFAIGNFSFRHGFIEAETSNSLEGILSHVPEHLISEERLSVVEIQYWTYDENGDDSRAHGVTTLMEITHYADPSDELNI
jgi:hypothetical protein